MENSYKTALAAVIGRLDELSESELRQLHLVVGARLGNKSVPVSTGKSSAGTPPDAGKSSTGASPSKRKGSGKTKNPTPKKEKTKSQGNPERKSQWANHPLYQEYSRLKKVVETQAKEKKISFNAVDTAESRAYREAFTQWVGAKSSFRGRKTPTNAPEGTSGKAKEEGPREILEQLFSGSWADEAERAAEPAPEVVW